MLAALRRLKRRLGLFLAPPLPPRWLLAEQHLCGEGIEIGALQNPMRLPEGASVQYVDRMTVADLRHHYPELRSLLLVTTDIVDNGETLGTIPDSSQDFVVACHFIEHCQDPIGTLVNMFRVLRVGGILYLAVPDRRYTFDRDRPVTSLAHLEDDYRNGPQSSRAGHFEEWVRLVEKISGEREIQAAAAELEARDYSIHYHVWTASDFLEFLLAQRCRVDFDIAAVHLSDELLVVLRKNA